MAVPQSGLEPETKGICVSPGKHDALDTAGKQSLDHHYARLAIRVDNLDFRVLLYPADIELGIDRVAFRGGAIEAYFVGVDLASFCRETVGNYGG